MDFSNTPWSEIRGKLRGLDLSDQKENPALTLTEFHDKVLTVLEQLVPVRKISTKKYRMPEEIKQLWRRISKVTNRLGRLTSVKRECCRQT